MTEEKKADAAINNTVTDAELESLFAQVRSPASAAVAAASIDLKPKSESGNTTLYGEYRIDNTNIFQKWEQLSLISPHTFIPILKLGFSLLSGFRLESEDKEALAAMEEWSKKVKLLNKCQNMASCEVRDGTAVVYLPKDKDGSITHLDIMPMQYTTLLPEGAQPGDTEPILYKGEVETAVLNESITAKAATSTKLKETVMKRDEFALFRLFHEGYIMTDILGRETYGIYGVSLLKSVDRSVKSLLDMVEGFSAFIRRYGIGRLFIDVKLAEELIIAGKRQEAKQHLEDVIAAQRRIQQNEDIVGAGLDVKSLSTGTISGIDVMKAALERDIHIGLLQSPVTMGQTKGTTYASSYTSEEDRWIILESIQRVFVETLQTEIIDVELAHINKPAGTVKVMVDRLDEPILDIQPKDLNDAFMSDGITLGEYRTRLRFPEEKPVPKNMQV